MATLTRALHQASRRSSFHKVNSTYTILEFTSYASPAAVQIISLLRSAKISVRENTKICKDEPSTFGYFLHSDNIFAVCTAKIKRGGWPLRHYINETIYHEAVHAAQDCKAKGLRSLPGQSTLGLKNIERKLTKEKLDEVKRSTSFGWNSRQKELEAYYLESKPNEVIRYLKKYCEIKPKNKRDPQLQIKFDNVMRSRLPGLDFLLASNPEIPAHLRDATSKTGSSNSFIF